MTSKETPKTSKFIDLINESVHTSDDIDIGDIQAVNNNFVVVKRGFVNVHYYYIPISQVEGWDGNVLWLKITEDRIKKRYEQDFEPDPYRYYVKDYPYYSPNYYPASYNPILPIIPLRYFIPPRYTSTIEKEVSNIIQCDLCKSRFNTEEELSKHVSRDHG
jgi:hypothetical protein